MKKFLAFFFLIQYSLLIEISHEESLRFAGAYFALSDARFCAVIPFK